MSVSTLNGYFLEPKPHRVDFIKENKKKLREISSLVSQRRTQSSLTSASSLSTLGGTQRTRSKQHRSAGNDVRVHKEGNLAVFLQSKDNGEDSNLTSSRTKLKHIQSTTKSTRSQSSQTIDPKRLDQLFIKGKVMFPSQKLIANMKMQKENRLDAFVKRDIPKTHSLTKKKLLVNSDANCQSDKSDVEKHSAAEITQDEGTSPAVSKPSTPTPIPLIAADIIRKTNEEHTCECKTDRTKSDITTKQLKKCGNNKAIKRPTEEDLLCPPGHIALPESEREKTLQMLQKSYSEKVRELNMLPVRTDTLRVRQKKIHLENQLNKLEQGIKVFSKNKVYVKMEE